MTDRGPSAMTSLSLWMGIGICMSKMDTKKTQKNECLRLKWLKMKKRPISVVYSMLEVRSSCFKRLESVSGKHNSHLLFLSQFKEAKYAKSEACSQNQRQVSWKAASQVFQEHPTNSGKLVESLEALTTSYNRNQSIIKHELLELALQLYSMHCFFKDISPGRHDAHRCPTARTRLNAHPVTAPQLRGPSLVRWLFWEDGTTVRRKSYQHHQRVSPKTRSHNFQHLAFNWI